MKLTAAERSQLSRLANSRTPLWSGVYQSGNYDAELLRWLDHGLIQAVAEPHTLHGIMFNGGFRITDAGRAAFTESQP